MNNTLDPHTVFTLTTTTSVFLILAILLVLARSKTLEMKLILIGVYMAITASIHGSVSGFAVNGGGVALSFGGVGGSMSKIAVILVLSGVALAAISRANPAEDSHVA